MKLVLNVIRYLLLITLVVLLASLFAQQGWNLYEWFFHESGGTWINLKGLAGLIISYVFLLPLIITLLGERHSPWLIALFLVPIFYFELTSDFTNFYLFVGLSIGGFLLGYFVKRIASQTLGKMAALEPMKRYF